MKIHFLPYISVTDLLLTGVLKSSTRARTAVVELMETTALGMAEKERLAKRPSARSMRRFPVSVLWFIETHFLWQTLKELGRFNSKTTSIYKGLAFWYGRQYYG